MDAWLTVITSFNFKDVIDILFVAFVLYFLLLLVRGTRAVQLLKGVIIIILVTVIASILHLSASSWLLNRIIQIGMIAIPIVFQPELRRALEQLGRGGFWQVSLSGQGTDEDDQTINEIVKASQVLAKAKIGALIVVERRTGLTEYIETGTAIEGKVSSELFINLFIPNTPLHDGAVIVRRNLIVAAGCFLPLTENRRLDKQLGTRHRAALGISEQSDGIAIVVSEETGRISVGVDGVLHRNLDEQGLKELLRTLFGSKKPGTFPFWNRKAES